MSRKAATSLCCAVSTLLAAVFSIASPLLVEITDTYSLDIAQSGIFITGDFVGFVLFVIVGGFLADKAGKKTVVSIALCGLTVSLMMLSLAGCFTAACVMMIFVGGFLGLLEGQISGLVADLNPQRPDFYVNMTQVFFGIGAMVGPVLASLAQSAGIGWQSCYRGAATLVALMAAAFIPVRFPVSRPTEGIRLDHLKGLLSDRKFLMLCLCMVFYTGVESGSWAWMCTFLKKNLGFSLMKSSVMNGVFWGGITVGRSICGHLTPRYTPRQLITSLALLSGVAVLLYGLVLNEASVWVVIALSGLFFASLWPLLVAYGMRCYGRFTGMAASLLVGSGGVGSTVIPIVMGIAAQHGGVRFAMSSPSALLFAVAFVFTRLDKQRTKAELSQSAPF